MAAGRTYVDFVPPHTLLEEHDKAVLRVDLSAEGFKKEQLRVQIDNFGRLRISGERPLRADNSRWRRFSKDFQVPEGCNAGAIRAKFDKGGVLFITMPKLSPAPAAQEPTAAAAKTGGVDARDRQKDHTSSAQKEQEAPAATEAIEENKEDHNKENAAGDASMERRDHEEQRVASNNAGEAAASAGGQRACGFVKSRKSMVWAIAAVVLALVGAGLYAKYMLMDPSAETAPAGNPIVALWDNGSVARQ